MGRPRCWRRRWRHQRQRFSLTSERGRSPSWRAVGFCVFLSHFLAVLRSFRLAFETLFCFFFTRALLERPSRNNFSGWCFEMALIGAGIGLWTSSVGSNCPASCIDSIDRFLLGFCCCCFCWRFLHEHRVGDYKEAINDNYIKEMPLRMVKMDGGRGRLDSADASAIFHNSNADAH